MNPPEAIKENPTIIEGFLERMSDAVTSGKNAEEYFRENVSTLTRTQLQALDQRFRDGINLPPSLQKLTGRQEILGLISNQLSSFREEVNASIAGLRLPDLSPETKQTLMIGGLTVGGTLAAGGALYLLAKLFKKAKDTRDAVVEKAKQGIGWLGKTLLIGGTLALGGTAAFFGAKHFSSFLETYAAKMKDEARRAASDTVRGVKEDAEKKIAEARDGAMREVKEAREAAEVEKEKVKSTAARVATTVDETRQSPATKEVAERASNEAIDFVLNRLTNSTGATIFRNMCKNDWTVGDALALYDTNTESLKNPNDPRVLKLIPDTEQDPQARERYVKAVTTVVGFFAKYGVHLRAQHDAVRQGDPSVVAFDEIPLKDFIHQIHGPIESYQELVEGLKDLSSLKNFDFSAFVKRVRQSDVMQNSRSILDLKVKGLTLSPELKNVSTEDLFVAAEDEGMFQKTVAEYLQTAKDAPDLPTADLQEKIRVLQEKAKTITPAELPSLQKELKDAEWQLRRIHARMALREVMKFLAQSGSDLLPLFHEVLPDREWSNRRSENVEAINSYLRGCTVENLLRFFVYRRMMSSGQPLEQASGLMAQQYEILRLIEDRDTGWQIPGTNRSLTSLKTRRKEVLIRMTSDLLSHQEFLTAIAESLDVSPEALYEAAMMLQGPAKELMEEGTGIALEPLGAALETYLALWKQKPTLAMGLSVGVGGPALWGGSAGYRGIHNWWFGRLDPKTVSSRLSKASRPWWFELHKKGYQAMVPDLHWQNAKRAGQLVEDLLEKIRPLAGQQYDDAYQSINGWLKSGADPTQMERVMRAPAARELAAVQTEIRALSGKTLTATEASRLSGLKTAESSLTEFIHRVEYWADPAVHQTTHNALMRYARPLRGSRLLREIRGAGVAGNALWVTALAAQGYNTYEEYQESGQRRDEKQEAMKSAESYLSTLGQELSKNPQFEERGGASGKKIFVHRETGVEVDLSVAEEQIGTVGDAFDSRIASQDARLVTSAVSTASLAFMGPRLAMGPAGLVLIGVEVTVRLGIAAYEQNKMRSFIESAPPWVLAKLGVQTVTGTGEYDWLRGASSWMLSDVLRVASGPDKPDMAKKMLFSILMSDLRSSAPEVLAEITGDLETPDQLDAFYQGDFRTHILPLLSLCLHAQTGIGWDAAKVFDIDSGAVIVPPRVTLLEIRRAMRSAVLLYKNHQQEKNFRKLAALTESLEKEQKYDEMLEAAQVMEVLEDEMVLGIPLKDIQEADQTLVEKMMKTMRSHFDATPTSRDTTFSLPINGAEKSVNIGSLQALSLYIQDPVARTRYSEVLTETTEEREARIYKDRGLEDILKPGFWAPPGPGLDQGHQYMLVLHAANNLRSSVDPKAPLQEGASEEQLRRSLTEDAIRLMSMREPRSFGRYERNASLSRRGTASTPLIFRSFDVGRGFNMSAHEELSRLMNGITSPAISSPEFTEDKMVGVFFEGKDFGGSRAALATFVYGDPATFASDTPVLYVAQTAIGTSATSTVQSVQRGLTRVWNGREFLAQPGARAMLDAIQKGQADKKVDDIREQEEAKKRQEESKRKEEAERPAREKAAEEAVRVRSSAIERSKKSSATLYIPRAGESREEFRATVGGIHVILNVPSFAPSVSADRSQESSIVPRDIDRYHVVLEENGKRSSFDIGMDFEEFDGMTAKQKEAVRTVLTQSMKLDGHPSEKSASFIDSMHFHEIDRLLKLVTYKSDWGFGWSWTAQRMSGELYSKVRSTYAATRNKDAFLRTLYAALRENRVVDYAAYERIVKKLEAVQ